MNFVGMVDVMQPVIHVIEDDAGFMAEVTEALTGECCRVVQFVRLSNFQLFFIPS